MLPLRDSVRSQHLPVVTVLIIAANVAVFVGQLRLSGPEMNRLVHLYGVVPARYTDLGWAHEAGYPLSVWPLLTSLFLHGGLLHILSNMWSMWIFADNIEDRMGPLRFLLFYMWCGVAATGVHILMHPGSDVPVVGASGALAGVLAAYLFLFPLSRILCLVPIFFYPLLIEVPAFVFIALWAFVQIYSGSLALAGESGSNIAWWAHVGGFLAGLASFRFFLRPQYRRRRVQQE